MTRTLFYLLIATAALAETPLGIIDMATAPARIDVYTAPDAAKRTIDWKKQAEVTEHGYDEPGLLVLEQKGEWYRVKMTKSTAWLKLPAKTKFLDRPALFHERLTYMTKSWDGRFAKVPGGPMGTKLRTEAEPTVKVVANKVIDGKLWMRVQLLNASPCEEAEPKIVSTGWVPAEMIWFYSRGC